MKIICWWHVLQSRHEKHLIKLFCFVHYIRVTKTYKIQKDIQIFQNLYGNLNETSGCHKLTQCLENLRIKSIRPFFEIRSQILNLSAVW